jgi:hypothetical protein
LLFSFFFFFFAGRCLGRRNEAYINFIVKWYTP